MTEGDQEGGGKGEGDKNYIDRGWSKEMDRDRERYR